MRPLGNGRTEGRLSKNRVEDRRLFSDKGRLALFQEGIDRLCMVLGQGALAHIISLAICSDGHWLTDEELEKWTDEMFIEAYHLIYGR